MMETNMYLTQDLITKIESAQTFTLNELCHASVANICRKELDDAIDAVEELENVLSKVQTKLINTT